jgi:FAD binding domain in molybdopterin dehydrogenase/Molybdopterin-binding domain of aldehyde dehydrogenase
VVPGIGQAIWEEVSYDRDNGQLISSSLLDYAVPRAECVPNIRSSFQMTPSPTNPIGVKGIGENGSIAARPRQSSVAVRMTHLDMPLTPSRGIDELKGIDLGKRIRIGTLTTHAELLASDPLHQVLPIFREAANMIADPQVRNRGTMGGSLANADPAADWPVVIIALKAERR